jgi:hypothetical protein
MSVSPNSFLGSRRIPFTRLGPVHFQPLEWELEAVRPYFRGKVLYAGCGSRDISPVVRTMGAESMVNADLSTNIRGGVLCNLAALPFKSNQFDTILCNAVLVACQLDRSGCGKASSSPSTWRPPGSRDSISTALS